MQPFASSSANMTESETKNKTSSSPVIPDWSLLPAELLPIVSKHLEEDCFDVVHARSVCRTWQSTFPFPSILLRPRYSLPSFAEFPKVSEDLCTLEKVHLFLFRVKNPHAVSHVPTSKFYLGGICRDKTEDSMELSSPIQCSVKVNLSSTVSSLTNMHDCQILPLGHHYRMIGWDPQPQSWKTNYRGVAFIEINKETGEFVVLLNYYTVLLALRSAEMRWMCVKEISDFYSCLDLVAFKGKFYASFVNDDIFVYDPYTLIGTPLMHSQPLNRRRSSYLVRAGDDDELFLVEKYIPYPQSDLLSCGRLACRVSILDEEASKWVVVSDLGDRVLFIGNYDNVSFSAKDLPDGCGLSGNSIVFTTSLSGTYAYKYGVDTGNADDDLALWRLSRENRVNCCKISQMETEGESQGTSQVLVLRVEMSRNFLFGKPRHAFV